ncbi:B-cell receptor CD22-like isoform X6 [Xiphophorus maculatus]|uniref:B-cell receptor CD22-like isoform X6 n=1 Tax=Xiphophorus maculatus TaxID=8083 RepID=UPI000C6DCFEB|nr:B-cell receptor CD22-like isoform X6 [Xiphophorus maculatus]
MSFSAAAATGFVVLFLSVTVGKDEPAWSVKYDPSQICAFRGSTVTIKCSYKYPSIIDGRTTEVKNKIWFTKVNNRVPVDLMKDSDYKDRITYNFTESSSSSSFLTIKDLKQRDSAKYKFRFITNRPGGEFTGSPGVTLTVLDLRVQVRRSETQTELKCESSCDQIKPPSYVWFNKEEKMEKQTSSIVVSVRDGGRYSCSVKGHDDLRSPSVYAPRPPSVSVTPSGEIMEGSLVTLSCSSDANPAANYSWYKEGEEAPKASGQNFTITNILFKQRGNYYCEAQNSRGRCNSTVTVNVVAAPRNRVAAAAAVSAVLILILICLLVWLIRKPKVWKQQSRPGAGPVPSEQVNPAEESVVYSVVHLATKQEEPLYCNTVQLGPTRPKRHKKRKEEETVEYVSVNCGRTRTDARTESEQQDSVEDPAALYSKVNKPGKNSRETPAGF